MKGTLLLVLVFGLSGTWAQGENRGGDQGLQMGDMWDELRALRDMQVEERMELMNTKAKWQSQREKERTLMVSSMFSL